MNISEANLYREGVINLLSAEKLPVEDLPAQLDNFVVAIENDMVIGVAGLELYGDYGLLRSVAVDKNHRGKGIGSGLLARIEEMAISLNLEGIYLLTETAADYFSRKGYEHIARMDIPEEVKASSEFSHVCPQSAIAMKKSIN
ncbi:arsenic resistance N-acetyltransferase ArsN2 [Mucilaginibacter sp.]|uniref:arsenic resistance N-acetyltransferase ArsN2 n=1 Tax=Mucilaginibacter sp. TaxID=1882438 RepID=UPI003267925F